MQSMQYGMLAACEDSPSFSNRKAFVIKLLEECEQSCARHIPLARLFKPCPMDDERHCSSSRNGFGIQTFHGMTGPAHDLPPLDLQVPKGHLAVEYIVQDALISGHKLL